MESSANLAILVFYLFLKWRINSPRYVPSDSNEKNRNDVDGAGIGKISLLLHCTAVHQVLNSGEETEEEKTPIECRQPDFVNCVFLFSSEPKIVFPTFSPQIVAFWENGH